MEVYEDESKYTQTQLWAGINIPYRVSFGTYEIYENWQAPIKIDDKFKDIKTIDDIKNNLQYLNSILNFGQSSMMYFDFEQSNTEGGDESEDESEDEDLSKYENLFLRDQQDCILWYFYPDIGVYIENDKSQVVAKTLPEFFSRLYMELTLTKKIHMYAGFFKIYNTPTLEELVEKLTQDELNYVLHYRKAYDDTDIKIGNDCMDEILSNMNISVELI